MGPTYYMSRESWLCMMHAHIHFLLLFTVDMMYQLFQVTASLTSHAITWNCKLKWTLYRLVDFAMTFFIMAAESKLDDLPNTWSRASSAFHSYSHTVLLVTPYPLSVCSQVLILILPRKKITSDYKSKTNPNNLGEYSWESMLKKNVRTCSHIVKKEHVLKRNVTV